MFKLQRQDAQGRWHTVVGADGKPLTFDEEGRARQRLRELFPVELGVEEYAGPKTVRVVVADPYADLDADQEAAWRAKR